MKKSRKLLALVEGEVSEYIVYLTTAREVVAYAESQSRIGGCAEHLGYVF